MPASSIASRAAARLCANKLREKLTLNSFLDAGRRRPGSTSASPRSSGCPRTTALPRTSPSGRAPRSSISGACGCRTRPSSPSTTATCADCSRIRRQDIATPLADYLLEGIEVDHGEMETGARAADHREAKGLRIHKGQAILVRRVTFWTKKNVSPFSRRTSIYRADRVSYRFTPWPERNGARGTD